MPTRICEYNIVRVCLSVCARGQIKWTACDSESV